MSDTHKPLDGPMPHPVAEEPIVAEAVFDGGLEPMLDAVDERGWFRRNLFPISGVAFLGGSALGLANNSLNELTHEVMQNGPVIAGAVLTTEGMWVGGAAVMAASAGKKIGNPFKLKSRFGEISNDIVTSKGFQAGLAINTVGAFGTAGAIAVGTAATLPVETWPGAAGLVGLDVASTVALRAGIYASIKDAKTNAPEETEKTPGKVTVRHATEADLDGLADIDLLLFDKAYGTEKPNKQEVIDMLRQRLENNPGWMFVAEMNGELQGFMTAFRTSKPIEDFKSWEDCTANGTLEGAVDPNGKYVYVANLTIKHEAVVAGGEDMLLANAFANGIRDGVEYGYFVGRMPHFKRWMEANGVEPSKENATLLADHYLKMENEEGKIYDPQVRMYKGYGFDLKRLVPEAFEDDASMDYGVVFQADVPPSEKLKKIKPVRMMVAGALRQIAKHPKLLQKVL